MKKAISLFAVLSFTLIALSSFTPAAYYFAAIMRFAETEKDLGKIEHQKPVTVEFEFTNNGISPLQITDVKTSCGCTASDWPKEAVAPGQKASIKATYNAASLGVFSKTVTVYSNAEQTTTLLKLKGEVVGK